MFFWTKLSQCVVQRLCPFLCHLGIPKCWLNWQLPIYSRCKIFQYQSKRKMEFTGTENLNAFFCLFLQIIGPSYRMVQLRSRFQKTNQNSCYIQAMFVLQIFWFSVFLSIGSDYLTSFRENSRFGLSLLVWRLA